VLEIITGFSQPAGFKPMQDEAAFKQKLAESSRATNSIKSNFTQEKNLSLIEEKVISRGTFLFKKENKVRMEYTQPFKYLLIINGDKVIIKDQQKSNSFSAGSNKLFSAINNIIIDCVKGTALENKNFTHKLFSGEKNYLIQLSPVKKDLKEFFTSINIYLDKNDYSVANIDMIEPSGDNTFITFINKSINVNIPDAEFTNK